MSRGGIPVQPFYALGNFIPEGTVGFPKTPEYEKADTVVVTFLVNNYDAQGDGKVNLKRAMDWEKKYVQFMKEWTANPENVRFMDVAFNSERSVEDELERETYGDIITIVLSYLFMFIYITFALGKITKWSRFAVSSYKYLIMII